MYSLVGFTDTFPLGNDFSGSGRHFHPLSNCDMKAIILNAKPSVEIVRSLGNILTNALDVHQLRQLSCNTQKIQQRKIRILLCGDINLQKRKIK